MVENWPNFFIVGTPKAGTSSLYAYLNDIPEIYMSPIKEPNYFSRGTSFEKYRKKRIIRDENEYLHLFSKVKDEKIVGEASPNYLADPEAPHLIHKVVPHARILISLRDPVERLISAYFMFQRLGVVKTSFHELLVKKSGSDEEIAMMNRRLLQIGLYSENVKKYFDIFGREQVKVIIFEEFIKDAKGTIEEILRFLGISQKLDNFKDEVHNPFGVARGSIAQFIFRDYRIRTIAEKFLSPGQRMALREKLLIKKQPKPKINPEDKKLLGEFYYDDVQKLQKILERKLPWPNFKTYKN